MRGRLRLPARSSAGAWPQNLSRPLHEVRRQLKIERRLSVAESMPFPPRPTSTFAVGFATGVNLIRIKARNAVVTPLSFGLQY